MIMELGADELDVSLDRAGLLPSVHEARSWVQPEEGSSIVLKARPVVFTAVYQYEQVYEFVLCQVTVREHYGDPVSPTGNETVQKGPVEKDYLMLFARMLYGRGDLWGVPFRTDDYRWKFSNVGILPVPVEPGKKLQPGDVWALMAEWGALGPHGKSPQSDPNGALICLKLYTAPWDALFPSPPKLVTPGENPHGRFAELKKLCPDLEVPEGKKVEVVKERANKK